MSLGCRHFQLKSECPICSVERVPAEQQARDMLERMEVPGAQTFSAGEVVELANLIRDRAYQRRKVEDAQVLLHEARATMTALSRRLDSILLQE